MGLNLDQINAQSTNGKSKGFSPNANNRAKRQGTAPVQPEPIAAPSIPGEQVGITAENVQNAALQRVEDSRGVSGDLVQSLMSAAQQQATMQAQAIAAYPQLVDQLTIGYLQQMGVTEPGKFTPTFVFSMEIPEMNAFNQLMESSAPKLLSGFSSSSVEG
jgi:hypothetical protein